MRIKGQLLCLVIGLSKLTFQMPKLRVSEHRAYECFQRKMECDRCGVLLTFKDQTVSIFIYTLMARMTS